MSNRYFSRLHFSIRSNVKVGMLSDSAFRLYINLMTLNGDGSLDHGPSAGWVAGQCGLGLEQLETNLGELVENDLVVSGAYRLKNYEAHQYKNQRQAKYDREAKNKKANDTDGDNACNKVRKKSYGVSYAGSGEGDVNAVNRVSTDGDKSCSNESKKHPNTTNGTESCTPERKKSYGVSYGGVRKKRRKKSYGVSYKKPSYVELKEEVLREDSESESESESESSGFLGKNPRGTSQRAATKLADGMRSNDPKARIPDNLDKWAADIEKLHRIDGRSWDDIIAVIVWCQQDEFWRSNIRSGKKLRKQFDRLWLRFQDEQPKHKEPEYPKMKEAGSGTIRQTGK